MASVKKNLILNGINTVASLVFPLFSFPYVARILMPEGIGIVNFQNSIINYLILLTSLGIPMYGMKEVARVRDNLRDRDHLTVEMLGASFALCLLGYAMVWILATFVPQISAHKALFYVLSAGILFNAVGVNWFYMAIEDFEFITVRSLVVKALCTAAIFIFVKTPADIIPYGFTLVGISVGNNLLNFIHLRKCLNLKAIAWRQISILRHLGPAVQVFMFTLISTIYVQLNQVILGFMSGDRQVGFLVAGLRIPQIIINLVTSASTVLLPRCSNLLGAGRHDEFKAVITDSLNYMIGITLPMAVGVTLLVRPVIMVFCGDDYTPSIPVMLVNTPFIMAVALGNVLGIQLLYALGKIKLMVWSMTAGLVVSAVLNLVLIPTYGAVGASVATTIAEFTALGLQIAFGHKFFPFGWRDLKLRNYLLGCILMMPVVLPWLWLDIAPILQLIGGVASGMAVYLVAIVALKDPLAVTLLSKTKKTI